MSNWFKQFLGRSQAASRAGQGHLTFGATSVGRTLSRTRLLLKKQLWIWPILAVIVLGVVGFSIRVAIERTMERSLRSELETLLNVEKSMLETWLKVQESNAEALANDQHLREITAEMIKLTQAEFGEEDIGAEGIAKANRPAMATLHSRLAQELGPGMSSHNFVSYFLAGKDRRVLSSTNPEFIGRDIPEHESFVDVALEGKTTVSPPFASVGLLKDDRGRVRTGVPTMYACAPVRDANFQVVAVLAFRIRPEKEFTRILQLGQMGKTGETYAIDKTGLMVSSSRFDDSLILLGLLPDLEDSRSILTIAARDPGGNLQTGYRPKVRRAELPLTKAAANAVGGTPGVDVEGYNDYRGVPVVGAWQWMPKYNMGIITEMDVAEAYRPLTILRWAFFSMFGLLIVASIAIFIFTLVVAKLNREAQRAAIEAKHLGQYRLEEKLGSGAMGVVYKGHHAMLHRPTAIKMLNVESITEASIERFEREVQITCKLNHPNTVAIYDYGRTPEGVFYYAMEYLDGIDLQTLVDRYGPQPEGRVIRILKQICGSLYEAHSLGLVHRDIKPANIMLNRRGAEPDVVKVLDFGLVKALDDAKQGQQSGGMSGTPLYMSPEAIQLPDSVDARSDLYAVGAVGYFLLTGQAVFSAQTLAELCHHHAATVPDTPTQRLGRTISPEFEAAILSCLEKSRARRPQTARDLAALLDRSPAAADWSLDEAEAWWGRHERAIAVAGGAQAAPTMTGGLMTRHDAVGSASTRPAASDSASASMPAGSGAAGSGSASASAAANKEDRTVRGGPNSTSSSGFDRTMAQ